MKIYVIGSLRNPRIPEVGGFLRDAGFEVFDDWYAGGYEADDKWKEYEEKRGRHYSQAILGENATHIFEFDKKHLDSSDIAVLVTPAGKSGHLELGYMVGKGKRTYVYFDGEPDRWDVMYRFVDKVFFDMEDMIHGIARDVGLEVFGTGEGGIHVEQGPVDTDRGSCCQTGQDDPLARVQWVSTPYERWSRTVRSPGDEV